MVGIVEHLRQRVGQGDRRAGVDEDPAVAFDRELREKLASFTDVEALNAYYSETLPIRNKHKDHELAAGWKEAVHAARMKLIPEA